MQGRSDDTALYDIPIVQRLFSKVILYLYCHDRVYQPYKCGSRVEVNYGKHVDCRLNDKCVGNNKCGPMLQYMGGGGLTYRGCSVEIEGSGQYSL